MTNFNLNFHLNKFYSQYPQGRERPLIGLTANYAEEKAMIASEYYKQVIRAGGVPVLIPPTTNQNVITTTLNRIDALILTGGADYNPLWAGEQPSRHLGSINDERDLSELLITRLAFNRQIPILGICRGIQTLAMALNGEVIQDIAEHYPNAIKHSQDAQPSQPTHSVEIEKDSILYDIYKTTNLYVNSIHHQAIWTEGSLFKVTATAPDGVIEAIESDEQKAILGVQWHPEWLKDEGLQLFKWLVKKATTFSLAKEIHSKILTLDTHCDTPMFFPLDINFSTRDKRVLVDLHKMTDGQLDATTMVAYLPQPKDGETFEEKNDFHISSPKAYADFIFDKIESIVTDNNEYVALARNEQELYINKLKEKKSIILGIENGLAIENDLTNIQHFAKRGVTYITLCHNGDNDICDSARGNNTHGGVSLFGETVIEEMNHCGVMVDLSHGAESSFYDALEISKTPIVCSHSNCKALCDVPRNLTDEQMKRLAEKGGVAHITLYHGFLRTEGEVDIRDAIAHLEHAINIMGIDHVGIGTDFDGDGGIRGLADASEIINFTTQLLEKRYSKEDITKIWGKNWLRVMNEVQNFKG